MPTLFVSRTTTIKTNCSTRARSKSSQMIREHWCPEKTAIWLTAERWLPTRIVARWFRTAALWLSWSRIWERWWLTAIRRTRRWRVSVISCFGQLTLHKFLFYRARHQSGQAQIPTAFPRSLWSQKEWLTTNPSRRRSRRYNRRCKATELSHPTTATCGRHRQRFGSTKRTISTQSSGTRGAPAISIASATAAQPNISGESDGFPASHAWRWCSERSDNASGARGSTQVSAKFRWWRVWVCKYNFELKLMYVGNSRCNLYISLEAVKVS